MKILRTMFLLALVLLLAGCEAETPHLEAGEDPFSVKVQVLDYTDGVLEVKWVNGSQYPVIYGEAYQIQQNENGEWVNCTKDHAQQWAFDSIGYTLDPGASQTKTYHVTTLFDTSQPGIYRFTTDAYVQTGVGQSEKCTLWAEFDVFEAADEAADVLHTPPALTLFYHGGTVEAYLGTYCWNYDKGDGTWGGICADALHPLDCQKLLQPIITSELYAELQFAKSPDSITVRCWHDSQWGNSEARAEEITAYGSIFELKPGGYIYEISAAWNENGDACHGTAHYSFYVVAEP